MVKRKIDNTYWKRDIKNKYGITAEEFREMLFQQENKCAICGNEFLTSKAPCIDHDHETGKIRGILCNGCNSGIGFLKDSIENLRNAALYLERNKSEL